MHRQDSIRENILGRKKKNGNQRRRERHREGEREREREREGQTGRQEDRNIVNR